MILRTLPLLALLAVASPVSIVAMDSFEENLGKWHAEGGQASLSEAHWKAGARSLRWDFLPGSALVRDTDDLLKKALQKPDGGIKVWVYCENPIRGALRFQAGTKTFDFNLNYTGWRAAWVNFKEDGEKSLTSVEGLQIKAPEHAGSVFLDAVEMGSVPWHRHGDAQVSGVNVARGNGVMWLTNQECAETPVPPAPNTISEEEIRAFNKVAAKFEQWMFGQMEDTRKPVIERHQGVQDFIMEAHLAYERLGLTRRGNLVYGPGHFCDQDTQRPHLSTQVFQPIALALAYDIRLNHSALAEQRFLDLIDYAHDQGWAAGSAMGTSHAEQLRISAYVNGVYVAREFLKKAGRLSRELDTLRYQLGIGQLYRTAEGPGENADTLRTEMMFRLLYILMLDDSPEKVREMRFFQRWANAALDIAPGYADTLKPDGTVFHHQAAYASAYGNDAVLMSSLAFWLLNDTPFALSRNVGSNLKNALMTMRFMAGKYDFPFGVNGRYPFTGVIQSQTCAAMAYLADAMNDNELGAAFARLWDVEAEPIRHWFPSCGNMVGARMFWCDSPGSLSWLLDQSARWSAEADPQGHRSYPFAAMNFHRRNQWVASVRGWSQYIWDYEHGVGGDTENFFARYNSYGTVQIFSKGAPVGRDASGCREAGWDWLRPPGATVIRVPMEDLRSSKVPMRQYTRETFVGGVALEGENGLWAMRFTDPCYNKTFKFDKSVFFVDGTIVCLGSGISNADQVHSTETVLYQVAIDSRPDTFPLAANQKTTWLLDPVGNGYYFPQPQVLETRTWRQDSMDNTGSKKTEGDYSVAWINHGLAPKDSGYCYAIRPDTSKEQMNSYAANPDFEVVRRDAEAHIVRFPRHHITGYALFAATRKLEGDVIEGIDTPCLVMTRRHGDKVVVAIADPDLRLKKEGTQYGADQLRLSKDQGETRVLKVYFKDGWTLMKKTEGVRQLDAHTVEVATKEGASYEITMVPDAVPADSQAPNSATLKNRPVSQ